MDYLLPAWHKQLDDWAYSVPQIDFDDVISHFQLFKTSGRKVGIVITDYLPQLATQLSQVAVYPDQLFSVFDYLQGITTTDMRSLDYRDFSWPSDAYYNFTNFKIIVMVRKQPYAKIIFDNQGRILKVIYLDSQGKIDYQLVIDSRGFDSSKIQGNIITYFDNSGCWRFRHNQETDQVVVNTEIPSFTEKIEYDHINDLLQEAVDRHFLSNLNESDSLIVTLDDQATVSIDNNLITTYSISRWHPYQQVLSQTKDNQAVVESEKELTNIKPQLADSVQLTVIPLFQSYFKLGHSQRTQQQIIAIFAENMNYDELSMMVKMIYSRLIADPEKNGLYLYTYSLKKSQMVEQIISDLQSEHSGEFILSTEAEKITADVLEDEPKLPVLTILSERLTSVADALEAFDKIRLLIDFGKPDQFIKMIAVSVGIPQLVNIDSEEIADYQNGIICHSEKEIEKGIAFFLDNLAKWNNALVYNVKMLNRYSSDNLLSLWKQVLKE